MMEMIASAETEPVWSVLDQEGTQNMLRSVLGEASALTDYDTIKKRLLGSRYGLDMQHGVDFNLNVQTSDSFTAGTLSALMNARMMYKKAAGQPHRKERDERHGYQLRQRTPAVEVQSRRQPVPGPAQQRPLPGRVSLASAAGSA